MLGDQTVWNQATCFDIDTDGDYYVGGYTASKLTVDSSKNEQNGYLLAFNGDDTVKWAKTIGSLKYNATW